jgi:hypothetical protein
MDIEGPENQAFESLDMEFACKYIKHIMFDSSEYCVQGVEEVRGLLYVVSSRYADFHRNDKHPLYGTIAEFQDPEGFELELKAFGDEMELTNFKFVNGELYFLNRNFF